jgi:hypothetical protein
MKKKVKYYIKDLFVPKSFKRLLNETIGKEQSSIKLFDNEFQYHLGVAFYHTYNEIFRDEIYKFNSLNINPIKCKNLSI